MAEPKDAAAVRIFPPAVPLLVVLLGIGLQRVRPLATNFALPSPERYWLGALIVAAAFLGLGLWSVVLIRRSGQSENPWSPTTEIIDRGPFGISRNPLYLQMIVGTLGFAVLFSNLWILLLTPLSAWVLQRFTILPEEAYLESKFGESYVAYKRRVRRWL